MTYEEAREHFNYIREIIKSEVPYAKATEAVDVATKAVENRIKYRWHDLRKDPDDLPTESENGYMVKQADVFQPFTAYWSQGKFTDDYNKPVGTIIAWKEIEPFEEVE